VGGGGPRPRGGGGAPGRGGAPAGPRPRDGDGYDAFVGGQAGRLRGVDAVDEVTLRVRLSRPHGAFAAVVAHPALGPLPEERWRADEDAFRAQPIGNGPFAAAEARVPGQYIRLQQAPDWDGGSGPAELDEVLFQIMDPETAFVAFQQGRLQVSPLPVGAVEAAVERFGESPDGYTGPGVLRGLTPVAYFLAFNVSEPPFDDARVRRAISLAIDREAVAATVLEGNVEVADTFVPPVVGGQPASCEACRHDPAEAAALLEDVEVGELTLWFNRDGGHGPIAEQVRDDLTAVRLGPVAFESPPFGGYREALEAGEPGFFRYGWRPEYPLADDLLSPLFHSRGIGGHNFMRYARDDVDALLDDARATTSAARRRFLLRQAEDLVVNRDQVVVPIMWYRHSTVVAEEVEGFRLDAMGYANLHEVTLTGP
jgi:oligopeptide transport system substrate-binding protein